MIELQRIGASQRDFWGLDKSGLNVCKSPIARRLLQTLRLLLRTLRRLPWGQAFDSARVAAVSARPDAARPAQRL